MERSRFYAEKLLSDLIALYQNTGLVVWGQIQGAPGTYQKLLVQSDGTVVVAGTTSISGPVDITDRWARQLGEVDLERYLGSAIGAANALHSQIVVSGAVIDPRSTRALTSTDIITAYGSQTQPLQQKATTYELLIDVVDRAARLVGVVYGSQSQQLLQRASTYDLLVTLRQAGSELSTSNPIFAGIVDASGNRLPSMDASGRPGYVDVIDRAGRLLGIGYGSQGQQLQQKATTYELLTWENGRAWTLTSSDIVTAYGSQTQALLQRASTYDLVVQLRSAGAEIDPRSIRALAKATDEIYSVLRTDAGVAYDARSVRALTSSDIITAYGSQTQALLQRASTYDLIVQLRTAGAEYDARQIRALSSVTDSVNVAGQLLVIQFAYTSTAFADGVSNTVDHAVGNDNSLVAVTVFPYVFNGSTWDRLRGGTAGLDVKQATRTNLKVMPEREDLTSYAAVISPNGGVQLIAGVGGKKIKVTKWGYHSTATGQHFFYFGTSTTAPTLSATPTAKVFGPSLTAGHYRQTDTSPDVGASGDGLYFYSANLESSMSVDWQSVQE